MSDPLTLTAPLLIGTVVCSVVLSAAVLLAYMNPPRFWRNRPAQTPPHRNPGPDPVCRDMPSPVQQHLNLLGLRVQDQVTDRKGIVTSVCFDLFGCIQAAVDPGYKEDGSRHDCSWFDINRLRVVTSKPVMEIPDFVSYGHPQAEGKQGSADKPAPGV